MGDYILSPEICVERKSVPDLFGSFASGRLFSQTEAMCRYYKQPTLLIEFSGENFHLQASDELPSDISVNSICSKIALLTSAFPALRILWSRYVYSCVLWCTNVAMLLCVPYMHCFSVIE